MEFIMPIILILLALGLFCLEVVIPSFGTLTVLGLIVGGSGVFSAFSIDTFYGWCTLMLGLTGMPLAYYLGFRLLRSSPMVLKASGGEPPGEKEKLPLSEKLQTGERGVAITDIRPMGAARFSDNKIEVTSTGEIIPAGTALEVVEVAGRRITVRAVLKK